MQLSSELHQGLDQILLYHWARDPEARSDFVNRQSIASVKDECRSHCRGEQIEGLLKLLQALLSVHFKHWVGVGAGVERFQNCREIDGGWNLRLAQSVLLQDM